MHPSRAAEPICSLFIDRVAILPDPAIQRTSLSEICMMMRSVRHFDTVLACDCNRACNKGQKSLTITNTSIIWMQNYLEKFAPQ